MYKVLLKFSNKKHHKIGITFIKLEHSSKLMLKMKRKIEKLKNTHPKNLAFA